MTVDAIVEAAARILETDGHACYSTNAVARTAGISIGSLYQYFPNKSAITRALIDREAALLLADIGTVEPGQNPIARLDRLLAAAIRHQLRRPALAHTLDLEEDRLPPSEAFRAAGRQAISLFRNCLAAICTAPDDDVSIITHDVFSIIRAIKESPGAQTIADQDRLLARARRAVHGYLGLHARDTGASTPGTYAINKSHPRDSVETHKPSIASTASSPSARKGKAYPLDLRERVVAAIGGGLSRRDAAARFGVSHGAAIRWMKQLEQSGSVDPVRRGGHKPRKISATHHAWLMARCRDHAFTLHGLMAELDQRGLKVGYRSVWEFVHAAGFRHSNGRWRSQRMSHH